MFSAKDVKALRERTGAGMMDCKKALQETNGNMDDAITWLREKGISKAAKKAERIAAEGLTESYIEDSKAVVVEVNCETDFVAKNEEFKSFINNLAKTLVNADVKTVEEANELTLLNANETIKEAIVNLTAKIGEKISFRRFEIVEKTDSQTFGVYSHMGGRITSLVVLEGANEEVAKDVAMHAAAMRPQYLNKNEVPTDVLEKEQEIMKEQLLNEGKPEDRINQILIGKTNKFYEEVCLENQIYIKAENKESVGKYVSQNNGSIVKMVRYEVGEGMEKRNENFAEEVQNQING